MGFFIAIAIIVAGMVAGVNVSNTFNIGYAYDFTTTISRVIHEIVLRFLLGNKYRSARRGDVMGNVLEMNNLFRLDRFDNF